MSDTALARITDETLARRESVALEVRGLLDEASDIIESEPAANTLRAYAADWRGFSGWCEERGLLPLPADVEVVAAYLTARSHSCKASTLRRKAASISAKHQQAGHPSPVRHPSIRKLLRGIGKRKAAAGDMSKPKTALSADWLKKMLTGLDRSTLAGQRDAALLLVGFSGAFRRGELVGLDVSDVTFDVEGITLRLRRSKTDQAGQGRSVSIPRSKKGDTCPVRALRSWLDAAGITEGALFRGVNRYGRVQSNRLTDRSVALIVKKRAEAAGLDPAFLAGHSLRSGFATTAAKNGATHSEIMAQTGHKTVSMVEKYVQAGRRYEDSAAGKLGL